MQINDVSIIMMIKVVNIFLLCTQPALEVLSDDYVLDHSWVLQCYLVPKDFGGRRQESSEKEAYPLCKSQIMHELEAPIAVYGSNLSLIQFSE